MLTVMLFVPDEPPLRRENQLLMGALASDIFDPTDNDTPGGGLRGSNVTPSRNTSTETMWLLRSIPLSPAHIGTVAPIVPVLLGLGLPPGVKGSMKENLPVLCCFVLGAAPPKKALRSNAITPCQPSAVFDSKSQLPQTDAPLEQDSEVPTHWFAQTPELLQKGF